MEKKYFNASIIRTKPITVAIHSITIQANERETISFVHKLEDFISQYKHPNKVQYSHIDMTNHYRLVHIDHYFHTLYLHI